MSRRSQIEAAQALRSRQREDVVRELLTRKDGRTFLWWMLDEGLFEEGEFHRDPLEAAYLQGLKKRAYLLQRLIRSVDLNAYALMLQEAAEVSAIAQPTDQFEDDDEG